MNEMTPQLRARIDAHMDAVEQQLILAGVPREKRRGIVDDLETQILDMIEKDQPASDAAIDEVFRRLDPPEAYGKHSPPPLAVPSQPQATSGEPRICPEARKGAIWIALGILSQLVLFFGFFWVAAPVEMTATALPPTYFASAQAPPPGSKPYAMIIVAVLGIASIVSPIAGTWLGWVAVERIRNSAGRLYGLGLAAIEALLYPFALAWTGGFVIWYFIIVAYYNGTEVPDRGRAVWAIGGACTGLLFSVLLIWLLRRSTRPRRTDATLQIPQRASLPEALS
jgi:hypothetical protein